MPFIGGGLSGTTVNGRPQRGQRTRWPTKSGCAERKGVEQLGHATFVASMAGSIPRANPIEGCRSVTLSVPPEGRKEKVGTTEMAGATSWADSGKEMGV